MGQESTSRSWAAAGPGQEHHQRDRNSATGTEGNLPCQWQEKRTQTWGEDSEREEGGTALTKWLELECRRGGKEKPSCGKAGPTIQHKPSHPHLREKTGRDPVGKGGSRDPVWEPRDLPGNLLDLLEQPHSS